MDSVDRILQKRGIGPERPQFLRGAQVRAIAAELGLDLLAGIVKLLEHDVWPERYSRNYGVIDASQQARLLNLRVLIVGCGGLGGEVAPLLARLGVGHFRLCDPDVFEENNFNRQRFCTEKTLGQPKPPAVQSGLLEIASYLDVQALNVAATSDNLSELLADVDVAIDCLDSVARKKMLEEGARACGVAYLHGSVLWDEIFAYLDIPGARRLEAIYPGIEAGHRSMGINHVLAPTVAGAASLMCALLVNGFARQAGHDPHIYHLDLAAPELTAYLHE